MPLEPGQALLHYRLIAPLGQGGMGVVWRELDTTLDREVALKALPEAFVADAEDRYIVVVENWPALLDAR